MKLFRPILGIAFSAALGTLPVLLEARGQGLLEDLKRMEQQRPETAPPKQITPQEVCGRLEEDAQASKCRGYYLTAGYRPEWSGIDKGTSHPVRFEVLVRDNAAALCWNSADAPPDQFWPCTTLRKAR
jgi:hypothetical protein